MPTRAARNKLDKVNSVAVKHEPLPRDNVGFNITNVEFPENKKVDGRTVKFDDAGIVYSMRPMHYTYFQKDCKVPEHIRVPIPTTTTICTICGKNFKNHYGMLDHRRNVHSTESIKCPECPTEFKSKRSLAYHRKIHQNQLFACLFACGKTYADNRGRRRHMKKCKGLGDIKENRKVSSCIKKFVLFFHKYKTFVPTLIAIYCNCQIK